MAKPADVTRLFSGACDEPPPFDELLRIWDQAAPARQLGGYPEFIGHRRAHWRNRDRVDVTAETLDEVAEAYAAFDTGRIEFSIWAATVDFDFEFRPGMRPPRATARVHGPIGDVDAMLEVLRSVFPLPVRRVIFISWGGDGLRIAKLLHKAIVARMPAGVEVFISESEIDPGADPNKVMLDENLREAVATVVILTGASAARPWVIWETATTWARRRPAIPVSPTSERTTCRRR